MIIIITSSLCIIRLHIFCTYIDNGLSVSNLNVSVTSCAQKQKAPLVPHVFILGQTVLLTLGLAPQVWDGPPGGSMVNLSENLERVRISATSPSTSTTSFTWNTQQIYSHYPVKSPYHHINNNFFSLIVCFMSSIFSIDPKPLDQQSNWPWRCTESPS